MMKSCRLIIFSAVVIWASVSFAKPITSAYTKINLETGCNFYSTNEMGGEATCPGYKNSAIHFAEGDLRQMVQYGVVRQPFNPWQSFGEFNRINDVVEWRLLNDVPQATILRWFIENNDNDAGMPTKKTEGQVLVVSTVGSEANPVSCVAGYVDARANKDANDIARNVADAIAPTFDCETDEPKFHGQRGQFSGNPTRFGE